MPITCKNTVYGNQKLSNKHCSPQWEDSRKKIHDNMNVLLEKDCEMDKITKFLEEVILFKNI